MKTISYDQLKTILDTIKGGTFATIVIRTEPSALSKTDNPFWIKPIRNPKTSGSWLIRKVSQFNGFIGAAKDGQEYTRMVNKRREQEDKPLLDDGAIELFFAKERPWGERVASSPYIEKDGKLYLQIFVADHAQTEYYKVADGSKVDKEEIRPFEAEREEGARQGLDNPVILRTPKLVNIRQFMWGGEQYIVNPHELSD